ncbi:MAG: histone deacetylase [Archaeoglobaceae archaeon]|nr:histone deacetylase [Archaeoglobaceae archaeon]MCX8151772.1 histone deacetylase [Archaeoglobaceae archaeon]MDW8013203.1 histone deacetylase [Archaeoglobaceae archaeon]
MQRSSRITGVFYHSSFSRRSYLTLGIRLRDFPSAFEKIKHQNFKIFECKPVSESLILEVHTKEHLQKVLEDPLCFTAFYSAGGVVEAAEKVFLGELRNAFCYIGTGGHHAGKNYFWGFCCFNDVVLAIRNLYKKFGIVRTAIIDTDAHHGDGTRELVKDDENTLHYCICSNSYVSKDGKKIDVSYFEVPYFEALEKFCEISKKFEPGLIFWYFGHDTHIGDYGDIGMTVKDYVKMAKKLKKLAEEVCYGKIVVVLAGGSDPDVARESTLEIIKVLLE